MDFLHTNKVSSCILIWIRFTNKRRSKTMKTLRLPTLARSLEYESLKLVVRGCRVLNFVRGKSTQLNRLAVAFFFSWWLFHCYVVACS